MTTPEDFSLARREFLCTTAAVLGAAALGLEAASAQAALPAASPSLLSAAYWTGTRLVDACTLSGGDASLHTVRVTIHGHNGGTALRAVNAHFPLAGDAEFVPFHAWTASPHGSPDSRFSMQVAPRREILLSALSDREAFCRLRTDSAPGQPKLRLGSYVLALNAPLLSRCCFDPDALRSATGPLSQRTFGGIVPARFGYRVITIERA